MVIVFRKIVKLTEAQRDGGGGGGWRDGGGWRGTEGNGGTERWRDSREINEREKKSLRAERASLFSLPVSSTFPERYNASE